MKREQVKTIVALAEQYTYLRQVEWPMMGHPLPLLLRAACIEAGPEDVFKWALERMEGQNATVYASIAAAAAAAHGVCVSYEDAPYT